MTVYMAPLCRPCRGASESALQTPELRRICFLRPAIRPQDGSGVGVTVASHPAAASAGAALRGAVLSKPQRAAGQVGKKCGLSLCGGRAGGSAGAAAHSSQRRN